MAIPLTQRGGHHFQGFSPDAERHLDDLRDKANKELDLRRDFSARSQQAWQNDDRQLAHELSVKSKEHEAKAQEFFKAASDYALRDRNGPDRPSDEIDLHGQTVHDAEEILLARLQAEKQQHSNHLRVITGQGIHSLNHEAKIKPAIERLLAERGFTFHVEEHNAGRIYVELGGNQDLSYDGPPAGHGPQAAHCQGYQRPPAQQHGGGPQNAANEQQTPEKMITDAVSKCASCCIVM